MDLSVVVPVFREAASIPELAQRCAAAARATGLEFELVFVDDASGDESAAVIRDLPASLQARVLELAQNRGQFGATQAGLQQAQGQIIVVLDGDLQDPPEVITELVHRHQRSTFPHGNRVTFAVKTSREDPLWFTLGYGVFRGLQSSLGSAPPAGSGSYCAFDREVAQRVAKVQLRDSNLAWVIAALGYSGETVPYEKQARVDGESRVGAVRLAKEALTSLLLATKPGRSWLSKQHAFTRPKAPLSARRAFIRRTDREIQTLFADLSSAATPITEGELEPLPAPVRRWLVRSGVVDKARPKSVRLRQRGQLRTAPNAPYMTAQADQYFRLQDPAFIWRVEAKLLGLVPFTGRDRYANGHGSMQIELASRISVVDANDDKIAQGALQRFLAEMVWYPTVALEPYVEWTPLSDSAARATLAHAGLQVSADFSFDALGRVVSIAAERFLGGGEDATLQPWRVDCTSWRSLDAVEVPTSGSVAWDLPSGRFIYYRWEIVDLEYDRPAVYEAGSPWK
ncbi:MAG: glycosyltransferase [Polyangiaceae bacterium]|nr:glycosyltransferase [Myxococcales bacterium]MCB9587583.1 glycosyltransferase [Polyangiaceae bacterium]MCB9605620.1 glycosyltransferase [Polyangiaceae bacterium]